MSDLHAEVIHGTSHEHRPHKYRTPQSPTFSIHLQGGVVQAKNGILHLTDAENDEMIALVRKGNRPDITQNVIPFEQGLKEAEAAARAHMSELRRAPPENKPAATRGPVNTMNSTEGAMRHDNTPIEVDAGTTDGASQAHNNQQQQDGNALRAKLAALNKQA